MDLWKSATSIPVALTFLLLLRGAPAPAHAQMPDPVCGALSTGGDACQKATDVFRYMNPQLGMLVAGGNATLGQAGTLGGLGHFALAFRINASRELSIPDPDEGFFGDGPVVRSTIPVSEAPGAFPIMDLAVGLLKGFPLGGHRVGGLDAIVNVFHLPGSVTSFLDEEETGVSLPAGATRFSLGARVGLLAETDILPGIAFTYVQRNLPPVSVGFATSDLNGGPSSGPGAPADSIALRELTVRTSAWRVVAGKEIGFLTLAAGIGKDRYSTNGDIAWNVTRSSNGQRVTGSYRLAESATPTNAFLDASLNLPLVRMVVEIGRATGAAAPVYNTFSEDPDAARTYAALGFRFGR